MPICGKKENCGTSVLTYPAKYGRVEAAEGTRILQAGLKRERDSVSTPSKISLTPRLPATVRGKLSRASRAYVPPKEAAPAICALAVDKKVAAGRPVRSRVAGVTTATFLISACHTGFAGRSSECCKLLVLRAIEIF